MGNSHAGHRKGSKVVTVLQSDGRVVELPHSCRVADLLVEFPGHFVCHSSALVVQHQMKMLHPNTMLVRGEVYILLPFPKTNSGGQLAMGAENGAPLSSGQPRQEGNPGRTMKFLITKQQLAEILAEGSVRVAEPAKPPELVSSLPSGLSESNGSQRANPTSVLHRASPTVMKRAVAWSPALESISEVPVM